MHRGAWYFLGAMVSAGWRKGDTGKGHRAWIGGAGLMEEIERSGQAGGALQGSGEWTLLMGWMERCGCKGACGFGCEQDEEGAEEGGEKQGFVLTSVEMLKKRTEQARPSLGFVGTGERELGAWAGVVLRQGGQG